MSSNFSSGISDNSSIQGSSGNDGSAKAVYDDASGTTQQRGGSQQSGSNLRAELANLKSDLDSLMAHASTLTDRELSEARDRIMAKFSSMRHAAKGMASEAGRQLNHGVDVTTDYVKDRPLQSVAIATGVGLLLGAVLRRR